eukprot:2314157-Amphidinium_carterae.1
MPLPGLKQSVYRAEFLDMVRALEECKPKRFVSDCKGVVSCLHALRAGRRQPKGRHRDLESRAFAALPAGVQNESKRVDESLPVRQTCGRRRCNSVERADLQDNGLADVAANRGTSEHVPFEPSEEWKQWEAVEETVCRLCVIFGLVGPKLRPEQWPRVRFPAPELEPAIVESERPAVFPAASF